MKSLTITNAFCCGAFFGMFAAGFVPNAVAVIPLWLLAAGFLWSSFVIFMWRRY